MRTCELAKDWSLENKIIITQTSEINSVFPELVPESTFAN